MLKSITAAIIAVSVSADTLPYINFTGTYDDPNHPDCLREIEDNMNGTAKVYGADAAGGEGAECDGSTDIKWGPLEGTTSWVKDGNSLWHKRIVVDFSPKGGPSDLTGQWNQDNFRLDWQDGNYWPKHKSTVEGKLSMYFRN